MNIRIYEDSDFCKIFFSQLAGNDFFRIMALSGHKAMSLFKRDNLVTEEELREIKWGGEEGRVNTYVNTTAEPK